MNSKQIELSEKWIARVSEYYNPAARKFAAAQRAYRIRAISDEEFLAARAEDKRINEEFDREHSEMHDAMIAAESETSPAPVAQMELF